jgi:aryl-alcohol dehydrogenase-like predicted oxidoreductase
MIGQIDLAGSFTLPGISMTLNRVGYGAMQLAGRDGNKLVWGPPRDIDAAITLLREAIASGVNHIDTADFFMVPMSQTRSYERRCPRIPAIS